MYLRGFGSGMMHNVVLGVGEMGFIFCDLLFSSKKSSSGDKIINLPSGKPVKAKTTVSNPGELSQKV